MHSLFTKEFTFLNNYVYYEADPLEYRKGLHHKYATVLSTFQYILMNCPTRAYTGNNEDFIEAQLYTINWT